MRRTIRIIAVLSVFFAVLLVASCAKQRASKPERPAVPKRAEKPKSQEGKGGIPVLMMGRSVLGGWFRHWTGDPGQPARRGDFTLRYVEIASPPDIANSVAGKLEGVKNDKTIVFFKFCFDDFAGSSREEAATSLAEKKKYVKQVYDTVVKKHGLRLIIGNALPKVKSATDVWLVGNERQFNAWLDGFAAQHEDKVTVFDEYGVLADDSGNLKAEYAPNPDDSHPNDAGYAALDPRFDEILETLR